MLTKGKSPTNFQQPEECFLHHSNGFDAPIEVEQIFISATFAFFILADVLYRFGQKFVLDFKYEEETVKVTKN